ncbi:unnamed protein product [Microthlaspi erraticum]|uniref:Uncharacterized protein n=1 Tax=Microthlaspi erraticum TaxID=1685480 RepID=A0A6D2HWK4_9BRAS|nr:unnamed protein product [Microthlaspi erraticum]
MQPILQANRLPDSPISAQIERRSRWRKSFSKAWIKADLIAMASAMSGDEANGSAKLPESSLEPSLLVKIHPAPAIAVFCFQTPSVKQITVSGWRVR